MPRRTTAKILATTLLGTMDSNALVPVIALYAASLGADLVQIGIIVGLYSAVHAPANLLFGRIADRWGRVRPLRIGLIWDAASMVLYAVAGSPLALALARISHGIGGGLVGPSTMALASDAATEERRGRAMALYGISIAFAHGFERSISIFPGIAERHAAHVSFIRLGRSRKTQTSERLSGLAGDRLLRNFGILKEKNIERLDQRAVQTVEPDDRILGFIMMIMPGPIRREDQVPLFH